MTIQKIEFSYKDRLNLKNVLAMVLIRGRNEEGYPMYAFVSMLGHRLDEFYKAQQQGRVNLKDFNASVIISGDGDPTQDNYDFMAEKYLFSQERMNVRIFP